MGKEKKMSETTTTTQLREAFRSPESRMDRTIVVVDVIDSTAMKEQQAEVTWLNSLGWMYDTVTDIAKKAVPDVAVKYLGDGIMLVVGTDHTTEAVNLAIQVQEAITEAGESNGGGRGVIDFTCSVGISTGAVVGFTTPSGGPDYVGVVVDKAFRLCSAANAKAIFADIATLGAANTMRIRSVFGAAVNRSSDQYQGEVQKAPLKGFHEPVSYHEVAYGQQLYGVKSASVTASTDRLRAANTDRPRAANTDRPRDVPAVSATPPRHTARPAGKPAGKPERCRGVVRHWDPDQGFGFIHDPLTGEEFHFHPKLLAYPDDAEKLTPNKEVAFIAIPAPNINKKRQAAVILLVGEPADGPLIRPTGKPYGWIRIEDELRHSHLVYVPVKELTGRKADDILDFTVRANERGSYAEGVELVEDDVDDQAAA
jgi:class 3 adenylate cyclase/cold shock CspA family protein